MIKIRGLIIPDEDKKYVSELSKVNPFTYRNIDFRDRIPLKMLRKMEFLYLFEGFYMLLKESFLN